MFALHVHLIFVAKYRRRIFDADALDKLAAHFARVATDFEARLVECNGEENHVHLLVEYPPKVSVTALVRSLKGVSSRMLRKEALRGATESPAVSGRRLISPRKCGGFASGPLRGLRTWTGLYGAVR